MQLMDRFNKKSLAKAATYGTITIGLGAIIMGSVNSAMNGLDAQSITAMSTGLLPTILGGAALKKLNENNTRSSEDHDNLPPTP